MAMRGLNGRAFFLGTVAIFEVMAKGPAVHAVEFHVEQDMACP